MAETWYAGTMIRVRYRPCTNSKAACWQCNSDEYPRRYYSYDAYGSGTKGIDAVARKYATDICHFRCPLLYAGGAYGDDYFVIVREGVR